MTKLERDPQFDPVIVAAKRTAVGKAKKGALASVRPEDLGAIVIKALMEEIPQVRPEQLDDVLIGCAMPEGPQGLNLARRVVIRAGLPVEIPAVTINRFCSSGIETIAHAAQGIMSGMIGVALAGGIESMSMVPMTGFKLTPNPTLSVEYPEMYINMGLTAENVADEFNVSREDQDEFAYHSQRKAAQALAEGKFTDQIVPVEFEVVSPGKDGKPVIEKFTHRVDEGVRADTTIEALSKLRPVFKEGGTVTAGNSSQTNDGAAMVMIMSLAKAAELGLKPLARLISYAVGGVRPDIMGVGPIAAIPKALALAGMSLDEIGLIELNEAFASQSVAVIREVGLNTEITNVNGGAIALGHPLGCTGAKLTTQLLYEMPLRDVQYGMVTMCIGGGMGAAGIFENLQ
ncbi:MAG: acetyl-CoA C-acyltransferase [Anaerolineales bacterium]|nr:acetyl-CoA C-acyltransferase [Anaerolineales bacterium]